MQAAAQAKPARPPTHDERASGATWKRTPVDSAPIVAGEIGAIGIIGGGRLGSSLAAALAGCGCRVSAVASRDRPAAARAAAASGAAILSAQAVVDRCDVVFLTVPDRAVADVCAALRWRAGQAAVHCSGALGLEVLAGARAAGALAGCLHPLQSFPAREPEPWRFTGITCGIEGDGTLRGTLERIARALGATVVSLAGVPRARYHAAAVLASNDVVALMGAATRTWVLAGLPAERARAALAPLLVAAAANVAALPLTEALTGPVARGDVATVAAHLAALDGAPELRALYRALAAELLQLDLGHSATVQEQLRALLSADRASGG